MWFTIIKVQFLFENETKLNLNSCEIVQKTFTNAAKGCLMPSSHFMAIIVCFIPKNIKNLYNCLRSCSVKVGYSLGLCAGGGSRLYFSTRGGTKAGIWAGLALIAVLTGRSLHHLQAIKQRCNNFHDCSKYDPFLLVHQLLKKILWNKICIIRMTAAWFCIKNILHFKSN